MRRNWRAISDTGMLSLPGKLTAEKFLARHWQKDPLFMPGGLERPSPSMSRNELAWLATLEDVECRIVFTERDGDRLRYRAVSGPFESEYLSALPSRDWTLLVHDVEKHLPAMRRLFRQVPFIPDWRIDDLMVSFAAPGGGVGPHKDNYDVFLCQGIGVREWRITTHEVAADTAASGDLALLETFDGARYETRSGDVLYLPPGVPHWGTAKRACMTYSIGMRAPELADLADELPDDENGNPFYRDADLTIGESVPGWISPQAIARARRLLQSAGAVCGDVALSLGCFVTTTKAWLAPERITTDEAARLLRELPPGARLAVHGMARIATDGHRVYANGRPFPLPDGAGRWLSKLCASRSVRLPLAGGRNLENLAIWLLASGAFEIPGNS